MASAGQLVGLGIFAALVMAGWSKSSTERANVATASNISTTERAALDACFDAVSRKKLTSGGSVKSFCGCFTKRATTVLNDGHKHLSVKSLEAMANRTAPAVDVYPPVAYAGRAASASAVLDHVVEAAGRCAEQQRTTFSSGDQHRGWCAVHGGDIGSDDPRCQAALLNRIR